MKLSISNIPDVVTYNIPPDTRPPYCWPKLDTMGQGLLHDMYASWTQAANSTPGPPRIKADIQRPRTRLVDSILDIDG